MQRIPHTATLRFLTVVCLSLHATSLLAEQDCKKMLSDSARLDCYDTLFGSPELKTVANKPLVPEADGGSEVRKRIEREDLLFGHTFAILPYRSTYILPYTYQMKPNQTPFGRLPSTIDEAQQLEHTEVKFQISLKVPLVEDFFIKDSKLWFGYTQLSLWQMYNSEASAPFRETNYEPEIFWSIPTDRNILGANLEQVSIGFNHQSNGRGAPLSRSWNRIYADFTLARNRWAFSFRPWYRIPEEKNDDDNPDIENYLGYGDLTAAYKWDDFMLSTTLRNNLDREDNKTSVNMSLSFPLPGRLNGYVEYVNGYGESLIDYNHRSQRIGIGFILNNWY